MKQLQIFSDYAFATFEFVGISGIFLWMLANVPPFTLALLYIIPIASYIVIKYYPRLINKKNQSAFIILFFLSLLISVVILAQHDKYYNYLESKIMDGKMITKTVLQESEEGEDNEEEVTRFIPNNNKQYFVIGIIQWMVIISMFGCPYITYKSVIGIEKRFA